MVTTKMNWSGPNCDFRPLKITIWIWPIHFGPDHFILVVTKSLKSSPNQFGQTKTILDRQKLFWSHRRHKAEIQKYLFFGSNEDIQKSFWNYLTFRYLPSAFQLMVKNWTQMLFRRKIIGRLCDGNFNLLDALKMDL